MSKLVLYKSFTDKDVYISWNVWEYCMDAYRYLTDLENEQNVIAHLLTNNKSKHHNLEKLNEQIDSISSKIDNTQIAEVQWTELLIQKLDKLNENILSIKNDVTKILLDHNRIRQYSSLKEIGVLIDKVSKKNIKNFYTHFKSSEDFKIRVLDKLNELKSKMESLWTIDADFLNFYEVLKIKAIEVYTMRFDSENIRKKGETIWVDLWDIAEQMFWWTKKKQ